MNKECFYANLLSLFSCLCYAKRNRDDIKNLLLKLELILYIGQKKNFQDEGLNILIALLKADGDEEARRVLLRNISTIETELLSSDKRAISDYIDVHKHLYHQTCQKFCFQLYMRYLCHNEKAVLRRLMVSDLKLKTRFDKMILENSCRKSSADKMSYKLG